MKSILDPDFRYVPSVETDIRKTFKRVRQEQAAAKAAEEVRASNVKPITKEKAKA